MVGGDESPIGWIVDLPAAEKGNCKQPCMDDDRFVTRDNGVTSSANTDFPAGNGHAGLHAYSINIPPLLNRSDCRKRRLDQYIHNMEDDVIRGATIAHAFPNVTFRRRQAQVAALRAAPKKAACERTDAGRISGAIRRFCCVHAQTKNQVICWEARWRWLLVGRSLVGTWRASCKHFNRGLWLVRIHSFQVIWVWRTAATPLNCDHQCDFLDHHSGGADADRLRSALVVILGRLVGLFMCGITFFGASRGNVPACSPCFQKFLKERGSWNFGFTTAGRYVVWPRYFSSGVWRVWSGRKARNAPGVVRIVRHGAWRLRRR